jgi:hypothetical protein
MKKTTAYSKANFSQIRVSLFFMALFLPALSMAQTRGKVEVIKDPLIDTLIARWPSLSKTSPSGGGETMNGYRVQIFFGSSRQAAYSAQDKFKQEYPDVPTYVSYIEPNFKVQAGDFRTHLEAEKLLKDVAPMFTSLFIIPGKINLPKSDEQ